MMEAATNAVVAPLAEEQTSELAVTFVVMSIDGEKVATVTTAPQQEVFWFREQVAKSCGLSTQDFKLVYQGEVLQGRDREPMAEVLKAAFQTGGNTEMTLVKVPRRTLTASTEESVHFQAHGGRRVFRAAPGCPTSGNYDHESVHYWGNHSSGGTYLRLELPETYVHILEVTAEVICHDQGWGGTGNAGAAVVLLDKDGKELAYTLQALCRHGEMTLSWTATPESHGGSFPEKANEEACNSVCTEGEGMALEVRLFTPDWGGWSVQGKKATLSATILG